MAQIPKRVKWTLGTIISTIVIVLSYALQQVGGGEPPIPPLY